MFKKRIVSDEDNIFKELRGIRTKKGVSLETIGKKTKIPIKYLKALEEGSTEVLPDILYVKNIVKKYLAFLNIDPEPFVKKIAFQRHEKQNPQKALGRKSLLILPRAIKAGAAIIAVIIFIFYISLGINKIFKPPAIEIYSPQDGEVIQTSIITVRGGTEAGTRIFINNEPVILDNNNRFSKDINLQKGLNLIKISGINKYSKENVIWRNVILEIE